MLIKTPPPIHVVIGLLRNPAHFILITKRPFNKEFGGYWEFPGGKVEPKENPKEALQRELKEELSIHCTTQDLIPFISFSVLPPNKKMTFSFYTLNHWEGDIQLEEAQLGFLWIPPSHLPQFKMPPPNTYIYPLLTESFKG